MKFFILAAFLAVAAAGTIPYGPTQTEALPYGAGRKEAEHATILSQSDVRNEDGSSSFSFASSDSINREEAQSQRQIGKEYGTVSKGSTQWVAPDGQKMSMSWVADETGFRPTGDHLPTPPPIPAEIAAILPTLPKLSYEELYGGAAYAAPKYKAPVAPVASQTRY